MARPKKEVTLIDAREAEKLISALEKEYECKISVSDFMKSNILRFKNTGLSRRTIYEKLTSGGLELGNFAAFSSCWSRVEKTVNLLDISSNPDSPAKTPAIEAESKKQSKKKRSMTCVEEKKDGKAQKRRKAT